MKKTVTLQPLTILNTMYSLNTGIQYIEYNGIHWISVSVALKYLLENH